MQGSIKKARYKQIGFTLNVIARHHECIKSNIGCEIIS